MNRGIVLAVALMPVAAFGAVIDLGRPFGTDIVDDADGYNAIIVHSPRLNATNNWSDDLITLGNGHPQGVTLEVEATLTDGAQRFQLESGNAVLAPEEQKTFRIKDTLQDPVERTVDIRILAEFHGTDLIGEGDIERTITVVVE